MNAALLAAFLIGVAPRGKPKPKSVKRANAWAADAAEEQRPFLAGFAADVKAGVTSLEAIPARAELYTGPIWTGYQRGNVAAMPDTATILWHAEGDREVCGLCDARDGETFTEDTLPGFPGEGEFGDICDGGPACRCFLEELDTTVSDAA